MVQAKRELKRFIPESKDDGFLVLRDESSHFYFFGVNPTITTYPNINVSLITFQFGIRYDEDEDDSEEAWSLITFEKNFAVDETYDLDQVPISYVLDLLRGSLLYRYVLDYINK